MPLPTGDLNTTRPPMPGLPPKPPTSAPAAETGAGLPPNPPAELTGAHHHEAVEQTATERAPAEVDQIVTEWAPAEVEQTASSGPPAAPFARQGAGKEMQKTEGGRAMDAQSGPNAIAAQLAELGFDGVDFSGFGAFPIVSLQKETFRSTEGDVLGASFTGYVRGSRKKWIYKNGLIDQDPNSAFFYTYDDEQTIKGEAVSDVLQDWKSRGWRPMKSPYIELFVSLADGEKAGQIVALSIPKTSIQRFSNFMLRLYGRGQENMESTLCEFGQGKEVSGPKIKNPWIPLDFKVLG